MLKPPYLEMFYFLAGLYKMLSKLETVFYSINIKLKRFELTMAIKFKKL